MSQGFVSGSLVTVAPYAVYVLLAILAGAACAACYLIWTGIEQRSVWRLVVGIPTAAYLTAVFVAAVLFVA
jgi:hypothetical protein